MQIGLYTFKLPIILSLKIKMKKIAPFEKELPVATKEKWKQIISNIFYSWIIISLSLAINSKTSRNSQKQLTWYKVLFPFFTAFSPHKLSLFTATKKDISWKEIHFLKIWTLSKANELNLYEWVWIYDWKW